GVADDGYQFTVSTGDSILSGVTSHGLALHASISGSTLSAVDSAGNTVFALAITESTGAWTFTQYEPLDHSVSGEDALTLDLSGLVKAVDFDNDSVALSGDLTVTVTDDVPLGALASASTGTVDEGGLASGSVGDKYGTGNDPGSAVVASGSLSG